VFADWIWVQNVVLPLIGMGMGGFVLFGLYRTVNRQLDRRHEARLAGATPGSGQDVDRLQQRLEGLEEQVDRLQELEERVDFAERMLAQQTDRPALRGDN
jgi:hypothetical protein